MTAAYLPHEPFLPAILIAAVLPIGFLLTRMKGGVIGAWLLVVGGTAVLDRAVIQEPPGFRMVALITFPLFALKSVVVAQSGTRLSFFRYLCFAAGWFGMRPELFAGPRKPDLRGAGRLLSKGLVRLLVGALLVAAAGWARDPGVATPLLMVGLSLVLHFGILNLQAASWRAFGFPCDALFRAPLLSRSLSEFWGRRWNLAFSEMTATAVYRPASRRFGRPAALVAAFLFSGLLHELAISVPVGAGYGLPTLYFVLHGTAMTIERARGIRSRLWTILWVGVPLPILFHPPFVRQVVWPLAGVG